MFNDTQAIRAYFFRLGLVPELADLYLALLAYGPQSISELARHSGVERTRIYRLAEEMTSSNLVEVEVRYKKHIYHAAPITNLQLLITRKEQDLQMLQGELADINQRLEKYTQMAPPTRVQFYKGEDGLRQLFWNQTKSTTENVSILYENMQFRTNETFFGRWARTCNERGMKFRGVVNDNFIASQKQWYGKHSNERLELWQPRYLPDSVFVITHSVVIYDDVTSYYNWKDGEIFGVEIYNQEIADAQRQLFEMLWVQGLPVVDTEGLHWPV